MRDTFTITSKTHGEWLKIREEGIGSSEVATVLGVSPYDTPYQLWLRKTGQVKAVEQENFLMKAGHYLEDAISRFCADDAGLEIVKNSAAEFVVVDSKKPFMRVSPDRYAYPIGAKKNAHSRSIIECKSTQKTVDPDNIYQHWFLQCCYQMHVTRTETAHLAWLTQGRDFGYKTLVYDADFCKFIEEEVERFWVDCVIGGREPALSPVDVIVKYPRHADGKKAYANDEIVQIWSDLKDTNAEISRLNGIKESLEEHIKATMLDAESLVIPAEKDTAERVICTWKAPKPSQKFDEKKFKESSPDVYAQYLVNREGSRRFLCK